MGTLPLIEKSSAKPEAVAILDQVEKKYGFVPNLMKVFAGSPLALQAYVSLGELVAKSSFSPEEQQAILLAVSVENGCDYCVAAHSMIAEKMAGMPKDRLDALRDKAIINDKKINELVQFTKEVVAERGFVGKETIKRFLGVGYNEQHVLEVLLCVAMKTLSNYTNHIAETPVDQPFLDYKWNRQ